MGLVGRKVIANAERDYSIDFEPRFPAFEPSKATRDPPAAVAGRKPISAVVAEWKAYSADKKAAATLRRYAPSLASLAKFQKDADVRLVADDDVRSWAEHRRDHDGVSAATVNRNDLVAAATVFSFAMTKAGGRLRADNPAAGVKLDRPKVRQTRDRTFLAREISAILLLARGVRVTGRHPRAAASRPLGALDLRLFRSAHPGGLLVAQGGRVGRGRHFRHALPDDQGRNGQDGANSRRADRRGSHRLLAPSPRRSSVHRRPAAESRRLAFARRAARERDRRLGQPGGPAGGRREPEPRLAPLATANAASFNGVNLLVTKVVGTETISSTESYDVDEATDLSFGVVVVRQRGVRRDLRR